MHIHRDTIRWAEQIFGRCELGDERRTRRMVKLGRRMHSADNLERIAVILTFIAVRLLQLREVFAPPAWVCDEAVSEAHERRVRAACSEVLTHAEWRVLWVAQERSRPPADAPSLQWAYKTLAKFGGWMDNKRAGRAGWEVTWQGWFRPQERVDTYPSARDFLDEFSDVIKRQPSMEAFARVTGQDDSNTGWTRCATRRTAFSLSGPKS